MAEKEVKVSVGSALSALPKPPVQVILYFHPDSAVLTRESAARIRDVMRAIGDRGQADISVVGHTDTLGKNNYNDRLSLKRARTVADLLVKNGVNPSVLEITSHGKNNPLIPTGDQVREPRNRRMEMTVR
jgi:outer membrane protein OmpA-like peptidoglycan-associated protein